MRLSLEHYNPTEAVAITGVSQTQVRNWRRAGYLPRYRGIARYDIAELLRMFAIQTAVDRSLFPQDAAVFAPEVARAIFMSLIWGGKAFSDNVHTAARAAIGDIALEELEAIRARAGGDAKIDDEAIRRVRMQGQMIAAAEQQFGLAGATSPDWFIIWPTGERELVHSEDMEGNSLFGDVTYRDPRFQGAIVVFNLPALAQVVLGRLPRAPIKLEGEK